MNQVYERPTGVVVTKGLTGQLVICEPAFGGLLPDGTAVWKICTPVSIEEGDQIAVDYLAPGSLVEFDTHDADLDPSWPGFELP